MGQKTEEACEKAQRKAFVEHIPGTVIGGLGIPVDADQKEDEGKKAQQTRLCQNPGVLGVEKRIARDAKAENGLFGEITGQDLLHGFETSRRRGVDANCSDPHLPLFLGLCDREQDPLLDAFRRNERGRKDQYKDAEEDGFLFVAKIEQT